MNNSRKLTEAAMMAAIYAILLLAVLYLPFIGGLLVFVLPVPLIVYAAKYELKASLVMGIAVLFVSYIIGTLAGAVLTLAMLLGAIWAGYALKEKRSAYEAVIKGAAGYAIGFTLLLLISNLVLDVNFISDLETQVQAELNLIFNQFAALGVDVPDNQLETLQTSISYIIDLIPTAIALTAVIYAFIVQWAAQLILRRTARMRISYPPFRTYNLPLTVLWVYFIGSFMRWFELNPNGMVYPVVINVTELIGFFLILQGFSFMFYYAHQKKLSQAFPIIGVVLSLIFGMFMLYLVRILGIIDLGFRLRERMSSK